MLSTRWQARAPVVGGAGSDRFIVFFAFVVVVVADSCHVVLCFGILSALALRNDRRQWKNCETNGDCLTLFISFLCRRRWEGGGGGKELHSCMLNSNSQLVKQDHKWVHIKSPRLNWGKQFA